MDRNELATAQLLGLGRQHARAGGLIGGRGLVVETRYVCDAFDRRGRHLWRAHAKNRVVTVGLNKLLDATFKTGLTTPAWYLGLVGPSITDAAITSGLAALTSASNPWVAGDAGSAIVVQGAGAAGADLLTTILSYSSAGAVTLNANAGTTVTGNRAIWEARAADTMASHTPWTESTAYTGSRKAFTPGSIAAGSVDNSASPGAFAINADNTWIGGLLLNDAASGTAGILYGMAPFSTPGFKKLDNGDTLNVTGTLTVANGP